MLEKIITPGITILEQSVLKFSEELNIKTGGIAPSEFSTERGTWLELLNHGLIELDIKKDVKFPLPTPLRRCVFLNVELSDACVYFYELINRRVEIAIDACLFYNKLIIRNPTASDLSNFIRRYNIKTLTVFVGACGENNRRFQSKVHSVLRQGLTVSQLDLNFEL